MDATDKVLAMLAYTEIELDDGPQLAFILAFAGRLSSQRVAAELRRLERMGLVEVVRRTRQGALWGLTVAGRPRAVEAMAELKKEQ